MQHQAVGLTKYVHLVVVAAMHERGLFIGCKISIFNDQFIKIYLIEIEFDAFICNLYRLFDIVNCYSNR